MIKPEEVFSYMDEALEKFCHSSTLSEDCTQYLETNELYLWFVLSLFDEWILVCAENGIPANSTSVAALVSGFEAFRPEAEARINQFRSRKFSEELLH